MGEVRASAQLRPPRRTCFSPFFPAAADAGTIEDTYSFTTCSNIRQRRSSPLPERRCAALYRGTGAKSGKGRPPSYLPFHTAVGLDVMNEKRKNERER